MENNHAFIKLLINEPVYLIDTSFSDKNPNSNSLDSGKTGPVPISEVSSTNIADTVIIKKVLVYCTEKKANEITFLSKILQAVNISDKDAQIIADEETHENIHADKHIYFGKTNSGSLAKYELIKEDKKIMLYADSLAEIENDVTKKKLLWTALQKMFL